ncbi:MAG TPA: LamG domain-containing protein, partial [Polyangiaceae bacterium]|nr:LamG domain-containing protein [Polyangiaceae bacterium]
MRGLAAALIASMFFGLSGCTSETRVSLLPIEETDVTQTPEASAPDAADGSDSASGSDSDAATVDAAPSAAALHLIHRYSFNGDGTAAVDSVGGADGELKGGATLDGYGHATLDGVDDYVNLPNGLISNLTDATL